MFVKLADSKQSVSKYVEKVRYGLHPSFGADYIDVKHSANNPDFEFTAKGYAEFIVPITLSLRRGCAPRKLELIHYLNFDQARTSKNATIAINKDKLNK